MTLVVNLKQHSIIAPLDPLHDLCTILALLVPSMGMLTGDCVNFSP